MSFNGPTPRGGIGASTRGAVRNSRPSIARSPGLAPLQNSQTAGFGRRSGLGRVPSSGFSRVSERSAAPQARLSADEEVEKEYGGRFLPDYTKKWLLGRGACGAVWLASSTRYAAPVAVKQVAKGNGHKHTADIRSASKEIRVGEFLFGPGGTPKLSPTVYPGIRHIAKILDFAETKRDLWIVMEFGGNVLTKLLFDIKGEFIARGAAQPRERIYRVHHLPFYEAMKRDVRLLKRLLRQVLEAIRTLADHAIVHSDLKPDNILLEAGEGEELRCQARLCDFGSAFVFDQSEQLVLATPEYMPPEALESCIHHAQGHDAPTLGAHPWSFDMWSLGAILLELCYGVPHWLSYKCRVRGPDSVRDHSLIGLFAVPGRDHERILQRQQEIVAEGDLQRVLRDAPGIQLDADGLDLLHGMLAWRPESRISPGEALMHPYLAD